MASTLAAQQTASVDQTFVNRVEMAILAAAQAISTEPTATANHTNRVALMRSVATNPVQMAYPFAAILASQGVDGTSTDAAISTMVSACWNTLAGVA